MLHYLNVVAGKTGALIRTSAVFGAMTSGASREVLDALAQFGMQIGVVFQLADDLMDIMSDDSGKAPALTCARASRPCRRSCWPPARIPTTMS